MIAQRHRAGVLVMALLVAVSGAVVVSSTAAARTKLPAKSSGPSRAPIHRNSTKGFTAQASGPATFASASSVSTICCMNDGNTVAPDEFAVADVNRDGIPDLVSANLAGSIGVSPGVVVALGIGDGTFQSPVLYSIPDGVQTLVVGDVNGDGFADIVAAEPGNGKIDILLGTGDGTFGAPSLLTATSTGKDVHLADVNGDGRLDVVDTYTVTVVGGNNVDNVGIFLGNGDGSFGTQANYPIDGPGVSATVADLNGDGRPDIVVADGSDSIDVLLNTGGGTFGAAVKYKVPLGGDNYGEVNHVVVADLNGDGVPDLVVADGSCCFNTYHTEILIGLGGGTFGNASSLSDINTSDVAVADVNGDGFLDIITTKPSFNEIEVHLGNGDGTFVTATDYPSNSTDTSVSLVAADLNRDGKVDLITGNHTSSTASFSEFLNNTSGVFAPIGGPLTSSELWGSANFCYQCWLNRYLHTQIADPVEAESGNFTETVADISIPGRGIPLAFTRTYNSQAAATNGPLGYGWTMDFGASLSQNGTTGQVTISQENGSQVIFSKVGTASPATYAPAAPRTIATLVNNTDGSWTFTRLANETLTFNSSGQVTSMSDRNGYTTTLTYAGGQLTKVTDAAGRTLTLSYTSALLTKVNDDQTGRNAVFGYTSGTLSDVTDVNGGNTHYVYVSGHLLSTVRDPRGNTVITNHYDSSTPRRVLWQKDGLLRKTSFAYSSSGPCNVTITDPKGNVTCDTYVAGLKTAETKGYNPPQGATWTYTYDPVTVAPIAITDPNSHTSYMTYDASGNVLTASDAIKRTTVTSYNAFNEPLTQTDPLGVTSSMTYDSKGNLLTSSRPLTGGSQIQTTTNHYADNTHPGDVTSVTDPDGKTSVFTYDTYGDLASSADPLGHTTTHTYNADGWRLTDVSPKGNVTGCGCAAQYTTTYSYVVPGTGTTDQWGDVQTVTDPLGHVITYGYDADRNTTTLKDGDANTTTYVYDVANEQTQVQRADSPQTTLTTDFNADGTVLDQKDGKGTAIQTYGYNLLAQVTSVKDALGNETDYGYDGVGNQLTKQDPGGNCTASSKCATNGYDSADELTSVTYSDGVTPNVTAITYDADGQKRSWTDGTGAWSQMFDSLHRLTSVTEGGNGTLAYTYNLRNLPTTITYPGGAHTVTETYDDAGRWTKVQDWNGNLTTITYDVNSNLTKYTLPAATTVVDSNGYNNADHLNSITDKAGATTFYSANVTRDANNQVVVDTSAPPSQTKFKYTALNQLCYAGVPNSSACSSPPSGAEPFAYDAADNLVGLNTATQQFNAADELCWTVAGASGNACATPPAGATTYSYDSRGNRSSRVPASGAAACDGYDQANRLTTIMTGTGSSCASPTTVATYTYNAAGLRMSKAVAGVSTTETWDLGGRLPLLLEDKTSTSTTDYVYGPGGLPLEQIATTTLWYQHDQLGSTRAITDAGGVTRATYQYDPYGNVVICTGATVTVGGANLCTGTISVSNPFDFAAQYRDDESGLYYLRARYYDPDNAQFLSRDPAVVVTREPYGYVAGNPLNSADPSGYCGPFCIVLVGLVVVYIVGSAIQAPDCSPDDVSCVTEPKPSAAQPSTVSTGPPADDTKPAGTLACQNTRCWAKNQNDCGWTQQESSGQVVGPGVGSPEYGKWTYAPPVPGAPIPGPPPVSSSVYGPPAPIVIDASHESIRR